MSQPVSYNSLNDATSRRYTGYPLNSTLVSSYTPDTIRSIISHAAAGQPYSTTVWIRISRVGIQISAQDPQIARTRIPVFIPIGLVHDIFMLPSINNVICIVYDEVQSNMKGVLLYVIQPADAQSIRDDFRIVKQANNAQSRPLPPLPPPPPPPPSQPTPSDNRYTNVNEIYPSDNSRIYTPISSRKSPSSNDAYRNNQTIQQPSPRRTLQTRDIETNVNRNMTPTIAPLNYTQSKGSYHSDHRRRKSPRRHRTVHSLAKRSDSGIKQRKNRSKSPEKQVKKKLPESRNSPDLTQQQQQQLLIQQQQQQLLMQQQMAAWQAGQQMSFIPIGMYNRYVPKTIPLPTGETLKTTLPPPGMGGAAMNGTAAAYIEPIDTENAKKTSRSPTPSPTDQLIQQQHHHHHHHRRYYTNDSTTNNVSQPSRSNAKNLSTPIDHNDETKEYLKLLVSEMQAMKMEINKLQQVPLGVSRGRSDSLQVDLKDIRSHIDHIRSRMAMTPRIVEK